MLPIKNRLWIAAAALAAIACFTALLPRTVKAATAVLMQLTNTVSNPAVVQPTPTMASQILNLSGTIDTPNTPVTPIIITPTGSNGGNFTVPNGQNFVVTEIEAFVVQTYDTVPTNTVNFIVGVPGLYTTCDFNEQVSISESGVTQQFRFSSGPVFTSGSTTCLMDYSSSRPLIEVQIHGYLTAQ